MKIVDDYWTCQHCQTNYTDEKDWPFQVDYINDEHMLVSTYYKQRLITTTNVVLNDCLCLQCVDQLTILSNDFEPEPQYTFEQNGYTCWNMEKLNQYKRNLNPFILCQKPHTMSS